MRAWCCDVLQAVSQVAVGPRLLDFGKVSAASRNVRYLAVTNPLLQSIHVVLAVANLPELKDTEPVSQVTAFTCLLCTTASWTAHVFVLLSNPAVCAQSLALTALDWQSSG